MRRPDPATLDPDSPSYYRQVDEDLFRPTLHAQGAWQDWEQHMAPVAGLAAHCMDSHDPREDLQLSRVTYDILGVIPAAETRIVTRTLRTGRTIELVEAMVSVDGVDVVRATGWRLSRQDTSAVAGGFPPPLPDPETLPSWQGSDVWGGGYIASLDFRVVPGNQPGIGKAWLRTGKTLVENAEVSPMAAYIGLIDTANGVATREHPSQWMYPNLDLTIHLYRNPTPGWVGFDTEVTFGEGGLGVTSSGLYDINGGVGRSEQILTVRPVPS